MKKVIFSIIVTLITAVNCNAEEPIQSFQELCFQAERDAFEGNLCENWEEIASNFWNSCQEKGCPVNYSDYRKQVYRFGHCDFEAMEKAAHEEGFSSTAEYEEVEFENIMNN
jgi:hypothetical protein